MERDLFLRALEIESPPDRAAFIGRACENDPALRARLEDLLRAHERAGGFLEAPAPAEAAASVLAEGPGTVIGRYRLLEKLGEGGFGTVYLAEQREPVRRQVALKIIKPGMDTRQVVARFEAERQALALMDHPAIARVLDGGATDTGRPFFVMELVRGAPITQFCDEHRLDTRARLELFVQVCGAIQHAHQKGIIHRDIKPSNVLVTLHEERPAPMVIDFGIAKAMQGQLTDKTVFTRFLEFLGTPAYMSPEQAQLNALDVDTRSDIYALGVLLYELLTGRTPFDARELLTSSFDEMRRRIQEEDPVRPSTRVRNLDAPTAEAVARNRRSHPARLASILRCDLDWIVMKCLEKDRSRRYDSVGALAQDVQRHLRGEPVSAAAPSVLYRVRSMVRRHRTAFAVAGVVMVLMAAARERFGPTDPLTVKFLSRLAWIAYHGGDAARAAEVAGEVVSLSRGLPGLDPSDLAGALDIHGRMLARQGRIEEGERHVREAVELARRELGPDHPFTIRCSNWLAAFLYNVGIKTAEAERIYLETLDKHRRAFGERHPVTARIRNNLALLYSHREPVRHPLALAQWLAILESGSGEDSPESILRQVTRNLSLSPPDDVASPVLLSPVAWRVRTTPPSGQWAHLDAPDDDWPVLDRAEHSELWLRQRFTVKSPPEDRLFLLFRGGGAFDVHLDEIPLTDRLIATNGLGVLVVPEAVRKILRSGEHVLAVHVRDHRPGPLPDIQFHRAPSFR